MTNSSQRRVLLPLVSLAVGALALSGCSAGNLRGGGDEGGDATLSFLVDSGEGTVATAEALATAFEETHEGVDVKVETRPGGSEGDNVVKTRLSTGDMTDVFMYNSGSLLQQIDPAANLVPMDDTVPLDQIEDSFLETVKIGDDYYGTPFMTAQGGGIMYNRAVYDELGLEVPQTWDEFMANNAAILESGRAPVIQTYKDTWTSQLIVLGDFHNVQAADPEWAEKYTANEVKYSNPPAFGSFEKLEEVQAAGYLNEDFGSAGLSDGLAKLVNGEGVHYPMLSSVMGDITKTYPDKVDDIGFFGIPGDDPSSNGLTVWPALGGVYIPKTTEGDTLELAREFQAFIATTEACDAQSEAQTPTGPYLVKGCELPSDVPPIVQDIQAYFDDDRVTPALEFLSPVKGPALEQILVEVGSGIRGAADAASLYDQDVTKQAQQLGLPGWS